jgi:putative aldouronate transport system substrate-binding protein
MHMTHRNALVLLVLVATAALSWAGGTGEGPAGARPADTSLPAKPEDLTLPIVKEPITLKYFIEMDFGKIGVHTDNYAKMAGYREMEKKTGIKVEFIHPAAGQANEKFNLMVSSGDLPDMMYRGWTAQPGGPQKMIDDKVIQPLNPLVARYAPNLKAFLDRETAIKKMVVTDDGTLYSFPIVRYKQSILAPYGWQVRGDWMDQAGLTALPETLDDWYTFLKTFKTKDLAGNGKTVPMMLYEVRHLRGPRIFLYAYGMDYG